MEATEESEERNSANPHAKSDVSQTFANVSGVSPFGHFGWFIVIAAFLLYAFYSKFRHTLSWPRRRPPQPASPSNTKKDDNSAAAAKSLRMQEEVERARQRLQTQFNSQVELHKEKLAQQQKLRAEQNALDWERRRLGQSCKQQDDEHADAAQPRKPLGSSNKRTTLRSDDYNPLIGGSTSRYRPDRGSAFGAGGGG